jgi:hypothetical protein
MAQDWSVHALVYFCGAVDDLLGAVLYWNLDLELADMTKDEALKLALEALEYPGPSWLEARQPAITAIREALAQPVDDIASIIACRDALDTQPVPELSPESLYNIMEAMGFAQRPWVGLTDEETFEIGERLGLSDVAWVDLMQAIEAKLREKNA